MKRTILALVLTAASIAAFSFFTTTQKVNAADISYTCQPNGSFASLPAGILNVNDFQRSALAMHWLGNQIQTSTQTTGEGYVTTNQQYSKQYTGPISGTFAVDPAKYPVVSDASIEITSPSALPDNYSGTVTGKVLTTPTEWRWIIQVYKEVNGVYTQVPKQALADATTGEFTIDLSDVVNPPAGSWTFGILDAENSYAPYGEKWPAQTYYDGLEVQLKLVTDGIYDWDSIKAPADNTFTFPSSNTGVKMTRLVDTTTGEILAEYVPLTGLIRSYQIDEDDPAYGTAFGEETFVYDQAIGLLAAISTGDESFATRLVEGLLLMQETSGTHQGGFAFAAPQLAPEYRNVLIRTGAHAIATDALLAYIEKYPSSVNNELYTERAQLALDFIDTTQSTAGTTQGLYLGGFGDYSGPGGSFAPNTQITWASTEHNIDIWHTFKRAGAVIGGSYGAKADALGAQMTAKLLNADTGRYSQGMTVDGPDIADPLDVNSWGAIQLYGTNQLTNAQVSLDALESFKVTRGGVVGYAPFYDSVGYPNATPTVWYEGSYGVLMAFARTGKISTYRAALNSLKTGQEPDGSFRYATDADPIYEISDHKSVASTAWFVLASTGLDGMWNRCVYVGPSQGGGGNPEVPQNPETPNVEPSKPLIPAEAPKYLPRYSAEISPITKDEVELTSPGTIDTTGKNENSEPKENSKADNDEMVFSWVPWAIGGGLGVVTLSVLIAFIRKKYS